MAPTYSSLVIITGAVGAAGVESSFLAGNPKKMPMVVLDGKDSEYQKMMSADCVPMHNEDKPCWARPSQTKQYGTDELAQVNGIAGCVIPKADQDIKQCCGLGGKKITGHQRALTNKQLTFTNCEKPAGNSTACVSIDSPLAKSKTLHQNCKPE